MRYVTEWVLFDPRSGLVVPVLQRVDASDGIDNEQGTIARQNHMVERWAYPLSEKLLAILESVADYAIPAGCVDASIYVDNRSAQG